MSTLRRVLITGTGGQVGTALLRAAPPDVELCAVSHSKLDITDAEQVERTVADFAPDAIVNAAAYTAVDRAESEPEAAFRVNSTGPRNLALAAQRVGARLLHVSTDFVFDGNASSPYKPDDELHPLSAYGKTKASGEREIRQLLPSSSCIVRTAWVHSAHGANFVKTMVRLMKERGRVNVVSDQIGTPTSAASVAEVLWNLTARPDVAGVFHWTDAGVASWYDFAVVIAEEAAARGLLRTPAVVRPITTAEYPTAAKRPRYSVLDSTALIARLGIEPQHWRTTLKRVIEELAIA